MTSDFQPMEIEFEVGPRSYRLVTDVWIFRDSPVDGLNQLREQVGIYTDLNTGDKIFLSWSDIAVLRFRPARDASA